MQSLSGKRQDMKGQIYLQTRILKKIEKVVCENTGNIDLQPLIDAVNNITVNLDNNVMRDIEYLCNPNCVTVRHSLTYRVDDGTEISESYTLLDGTPYTGDLLLLDPDCSKCDDQSVSVVFTEKVCKVDDENGDRTSYIPYVCIVQVLSDNTINIQGTYNSNLSAVYSPNNPTDPSTVGLPANGKAGRRILSDGEVYSPSGLVKSFTVKPVGNNTTFTDSYGIVTNMQDGVSETWGWDNVQSDGIPIVSGPAIIVFTSY